MKNYKKISIIIPNLHSPIINQTLDSLLIQDTSIPFEIIIVGQDKYRIIEKVIDKRVKFIETENPTPPALARNLGVAASTGDYLVFIDSDCVAAKNFLEMHLTANGGNDRKLVGGAVKIDSNENYWTLSDNIATFHEVLSHMPPGPRDILPSLNLSLSKSLWDQIGGFDPKYPKAAGEDADFSFQARKKGNDVIFTPDAIVTHLHKRDSLTSILKHAYNFGKYSIKFNPNNNSASSIPNFIKKNKWILIYLSPLLAFFIILKILFYERLPFKYIHTVPVIYMAKIAWCFGAAKNQFYNKKIL